MPYYEQIYVIQHSERKEYYINTKTGFETKKSLFPVKHEEAMEIIFTETDKNKFIDKFMGSFSFEKDILKVIPVYLNKEGQIVKSMV